MKKISSARYIAVTAMLAAVSIVLMQFDFSVPLMPSFIKMDISDLPALIGTFALGPVCGVMTELIKNLLHLLRTSTGGVGELSNFLLGCAFVLPAGLIYKAKKTKKSALIAAVVGALCMAVLSVFTNYFIVYPVYYNFMAKEVIVAAYDAIASGVFGTHVSGILQCLICFNMPFTFIKGMLSVIVTMLIYKPLSPILKGRN